jgi:hypothetical protein
MFFGTRFCLAPTLPRMNVAGLMEDSSGWIASSDKGVFRYHGNTVVNYNQFEELGENLRKRHRAGQTGQPVVHHEDRHLQV